MGAGLGEVLVGGVVPMRALDEQFKELFSTYVGPVLPAFEDRMRHIDRSGLVLKYGSR